MGLALVLLGVGGFAMWSSQVTGSAADAAIAASRLSDDYATAATAISAEESFEREYRLVPGPDILARFDEAAATFVSAMGDVRRDGGPLDVVLVDRALLQHVAYLRGIKRLFAARDRGDLPAVLRIDRNEADPPFEIIEETVLGAAKASHERSLEQLDTLKEQERLNRLLTPSVLLLGLAIAAMLAWVVRGHRRQLVSERAQALHAALHDPLSGLPNRALLHDRLGHALHANAKAGTRVGLLLIDLDRFKEINDTFGHRYGDVLLQQIGPRLTSTLREADTVARLGGDEFAVILPETGTVAAAVEVATKLREALEPAFQVFDVDLNIEASIGVVISGEHGLDTDTLLQRADIAMYAAKSQGLGVCSYSLDADQNSPVRVALLGELRKAIDHCDLELFYQPKVSVSTGELTGVEALIRWRHKTRGLIFPDDFIPLAEHTELIGPLTRYVLDAALAQARAWIDAKTPLTVSVNLSARNLLDARLPDVVAKLLATHGVAPQLLELEVTESAIMSDPLRARQILERLAASGIRISIDDFGAGYTSLSQLKTMPITELKIDKSFVMTMVEDTSNAVIVQSVIALGHNLGLTIVAEGVENQQVLTELTRQGCDVAQGYHFARPVPASQFETWWNQYNQDLLPLMTQSSVEQANRVAAPATSAN